ncbi:hypothetical protein ERJ75_000594600 [Trypanosoma vivax]|nr:hypothetical protein ERJ75_000594600 [Trypanosoma vivax]
MSGEHWYRKPGNKERNTSNLSEYDERMGKYPGAIGEETVHACKQSREKNSHVPGRLNDHSRRYGDALHAKRGADACAEKTTAEFGAACARTKERSREEAVSRRSLGKPCGGDGVRANGTEMG